MQPYPVQLLNVTRCRCGVAGPRRSRAGHKIPPGRGGQQAAIDKPLYLRKTVAILMIRFHFQGQIT